jgi:hypothetical protein
MDFSCLRDWFAGNSQNQITAIQFETDGKITILTKGPVVRDINAAIKSKTFSPGPGGYEQTTLKVGISGNHWGEMNIGRSSNSDVITIGIPSEFSIHPEFVFSNLKVETNTVDALYRTIGNINSSVK